MFLNCFYFTLTVLINLLSIWLKSQLAEFSVLLYFPLSQEHRVDAILRSVYNISAKKLPVSDGFTIQKRFSAPPLTTNKTPTLPVTLPLTRYDDKMPI